ncbi:MAG: ABC transporter ATP-binding protein [Phycisphaerae bacterium]
MPDQTQPPDQTTRAILARLLRLVLHFRRGLIILALLSLAGMAIELASVRLIGTGFNHIQQLGQQMEPSTQAPFWSSVLHPDSRFLREIRWLAIAIIALAAVRGLASLLTTVERARLGQNVVRGLRSRLYAALQKLSLAYYDRNFTGQIINRVTRDVRNIQRFLLSASFQTFEASIYLFGYAGLMAWINWKLMLVSLITTPIVIALLVNLSRKLRPAFRATRQAEDVMITALQENIAGVRVVRAFARQQGEIDRFHATNEQVFACLLRVVDLFRRNMPTIRLVSRLSLLVLLAYGGWLVLRDRLLIGDLVIFSSGITVITNRIRNIVQITNVFQEAMASAERVFEILDARPEVKEKRSARPLPPGRGEVVFDNVTFGYQPDRPILHAVNLHVQPGEVLAIIGPTGAGKTSLVNLLPRFYDPQIGRILLDGIDLRDLQLASLRSQIGLVFQESFLFSDTISNNIAYGVPDATDEQIRQAARIAHADEFIEQLDDGYETVIGERGVSLSGGERQRLAIARAIVSDPRVLILDDPLAAVDPATEHQIIDELEDAFRDRTVFLIAHRLSCLSRADRVVVLEAGRIQQVGSHEKLIVTSDHYRQMARLQMTADYQDLTATQSR